VTGHSGHDGAKLIDSIFVHLTRFVIKTIGGWSPATCVLLVGLSLGSIGCSSASRNQQNLDNAQSKVKSPELSSSVALHIESVIQHGHIIEISGSTDRGAVVMINGQTASTIFGANRFRQFLGPLPSGTTIITVTAQDEKGSVNTQQIAATIQ
jgi:hypothetical protein